MSLPDLSGQIPGLVHVLTPPQVAKLIGWSRRRTFRYLLLANARMGGRLLHDASMGSKRPRWTVSVAALKGIAGQWFNDIDQVQMEFEFLRDHAIKREETVEEMRSKMRVMEEQIRMLVEKVGGQP